MIRFLTKILQRFWLKHKRLHVKRLRRQENQIRLGIALVFYGLIVWAIIQDDVMLGLSFMLAGGIAIFTGAIYKSKEVMWLVLVGVAIGTVVPTLARDALDSYGNGDYVGAIILIVFAVFFWLLASSFKKGDPPNDW